MDATKEETEMHTLSYIKNGKSIVVDDVESASVFVNEEQRTPDDEAAAFLEVNVTHEGLILDVWGAERRETILTQAGTFQEIIDSMED